MPNNIRNRRIVQDESDDGSDSAPQPSSSRTRNLKRVDSHTSEAQSPPRRSRASTQQQKKKRQPSKQPKRQSPHKQQPSKKDAGTIYSFFNSATQRQQRHPVYQNGSEKENEAEAEDVAEEVEDIEDDGEDAAKPARLRLGDPDRHSSHDSVKRAHADIADSRPDTREHTPKFVKTSDGGRFKASTVIPERPKIADSDGRAWTERYKPRSMDELGVNKKKAAEVDAWIQRAVSGQAKPRTLILRGPSGSGKTTVVELSAEKAGINLKKWTNPSSTEFGTGEYVSWATQFEDYIGSGSKFQALDLSDSGPTQQTDSYNDSGQFLVIEEFPALASDSAVKAFRSILLQQISFNASRTAAAGPGRIAPTILIVSESVLSNSTTASDKFTAHRLLGPEILNHPYVDMIEFNEVAPTFLTKAMKLIVQRRAQDTRRPPFASQKVIAKLSSLKDLRQAVSTLQFLESQAKQPAVTIVKRQGSGDRTPQPQNAAQEAERAMLDLIEERHGNLSLFHAVGKVVYNKRLESDSASVAKPELELNVDGLFSTIGTDTSTFVSALHENFVLSCYTPSSNREVELDCINDCIDSLSDADMLYNTSRGAGAGSYVAAAGETVRQDEIAFHVAVRGILWGLPWPLKRQSPKFTGTLAGLRYDHHRMYYPKDFKLWRLREETSGCLERIMSRTLDGTLDKDLNQVLSGDQRAAADESPTAHAMVGASTASCDVILDRLPYLANMLAWRQVQFQNAPNLQRDIDRVTRFRGRGLIAGEHDDDDDDEDQQLDAHERLRGNPFGSVAGGKRRGNAAASSVHGDAEAADAAKGLVLSDDDIEDDF